MAGKPERIEHSVLDTTGISFAVAQHVETSIWPEVLIDGSLTRPVPDHLLRQVLGAAAILDTEKTAPPVVPSTKSNSKPVTNDIY